MQVTVCPFSVAFETTFTVGLSGDNTTLGSNAEDSFINDFSGKLTGTLKGDFVVGKGGKGSLEGSSTEHPTAGALLVDLLTGATLAICGLVLGFACMASGTLF